MRHQIRSECCKHKIHFWQSIHHLVNVGKIVAARKTTVIFHTKAKTNQVYEVRGEGRMSFMPSWTDNKLIVLATKIIS